MSTSAVLFLTAVLCGLGFAGLWAWVQTLGPGSSLKTVRWTKPALFLAGCVAFGSLAFFLDSDNAGTTLYEIDAQGSTSTMPDALRFDIPVEHAGVAHDLLVDPKPDHHISVPAVVRVQLTDTAGRVVLDDSESLAPDCDWDSDGCEWDSYSRTFTPATTGTYTLVVTLLTPDVPDLHVRVGDPDKTDGHRAPGY